MSFLQGVTSWVLRLFRRREEYDNARNTLCNEQGSFSKNLISSVEFFKRFENRVDFKDKTVLDVGCGRGATCLLMALNGGKKVVGIDINQDAIFFARSQLQKYPNLHDILAFKLPGELEKEEFDLVLSKDCFGHYDSPEDFILIMKQYLKPDGQMIIGFSPLWKSPYGGHLSSFTKWPWVHLLFPEPILMRELRRYWKDENVKSFKQVAGGLNKMTYARYLKIIKESGFEFQFFRTNVSSQPKEHLILKIFKILSLIPPVREYFTVNLYSILRLERALIY